MSYPATSQAGSAIEVEGRSPSVLLSHPTGNQNVRNVLRGLVEHGMLGEFWTAIAWDTESRWNRLLPPGLRAQLSRRTFEGVPKECVRCVPSREIIRLGARACRVDGVVCEGERPFSVIGMYRHFDAAVARNLERAGADAVYAYEGGALETFREAKRLGIAALYELTTGHWFWKRKVLKEEAERNPGFASLLPQLKDSERHWEEKGEELCLADRIYVPSQHVRRTLDGVVPDEKICVIGYGAPPVRRQKQVSLDAKDPLKVLFVGNLAQGKGISYLLDAIDMLGSRVELTLVGKRIGAHARVNEACSRWRWLGAVPHSTVLERMEQSDVLVFPSFSEGFGLVVTEALACGLPVIVTPNVGASDLVCDGREGFQVPTGSAEAIADRLNALDRDRALLAHMSKNAQETAALCSWENYRQALAESLKAATWR